MKRVVVLLFAVLIATLALADVNYNPMKVIITPVPGSQLEAEIWIDREAGSLYRTGEEVKVFFRVNKDAYVAIYDIMPDGEIQLIFPNNYDKDNFLEAGKTYSLPTKKAALDYGLTLAGIPGKEIFQLVASTTPLLFLNDFTSQFSASNAFPKAAQKAEEFVTSKVIPVIGDAEYAVSTTYFYLDKAETKGRIVVTSVPSQANVYIDGSYYGKTPFNTNIEAGAHVVTVFKDGYEIKTDSVIIPAGGTKSVNFLLNSLITKYALTVNTNPSGAAVYINNVYYGLSPLTVELDPGNYSLRAELDGYQPYNDTVSLSRSLTKNLNLSSIITNYNLVVRTNPSGAKVYIDDRYFGRSPLTVTLERGVKNLRVELDDYDTYTEVLNLNQSMTRNINLNKVIKRYSLSVNTSPSGAKVYVNNIYRGLSPLSLILDDGIYDVRISETGYNDFNQRLVLNSDRVVNATLEKIIQNYRLSINSSPSGAMVYVNNAYRGRAPLSLILEEGFYDVTLTETGYEDYSERVMLDGTKTMNVTLKEEKSTLNINSNPSGADIYVDGNFIGRAPLAYTTDPGQHVVEAQLNGYIGQTKTITVNPGSSSTVNFVLEEEKKVADVMIKTSPSNARIFVDGYERGRSNTSLELEPGYHEILIIKEGYRFIYVASYFDVDSYEYEYTLIRIQ